MLTPDKCHFQVYSDTPLMLVNSDELFKVLSVSNGEGSTLTKQSIPSSLRLSEHCPIGGTEERMQELENKAKSMKQQLLAKTQSYRCLHWVHTRWCQ